MFTDAMPFVTNYVFELAKELSQRHPELHLSGNQQKWLSFCLTGMLLTGTLCWAAFTRMGLGAYSIGALSKRLKKAGIKAAKRPKAPKPDPDYPSKIEIALALIDDFHRNNPDVTIKSVLADAAFGTRRFMEGARAKTGCKQVITNASCAKIVMFRNKWITVKAYFSKHEGVSQVVSVRGGKTNEMTVGSARLVFKAHGTKNFIVAVKNQDEAEYRYLVATDLTWRTLDILQCYTLRWLVEVFFEDWKLYEGWTNSLAKRGQSEE